MTQTTPAPSGPQGVAATWAAFRGSALAPRRAILRQVPLAGRRLVAGLVAVNLGLAMLPLVFVVMTSRLIGHVPDAVDAGVGSPAWDELVAAFLWAAAAFLALQVLAPVQVTLGELVRRRIDGRYYDRIMTVSLRSTGVGPLEDQPTLDALHEASEGLLRGFETPGRAAAGLLALIARYGQLIGCCVLVGVVVSPWVGAVLFAAVMAFRYGQRGGLRKYSQIWRTISSTRREVQYLSELSSGTLAAKEIRVFGLQPWLGDRLAQRWTQMYAPVWRERRRIYLTPFLVITAIGLAAAVTVFVTVGREAASGAIDLTAMALGLQASIQALLLGQYYPEADAPTQFGMLAASGLDRFERLVQDHEPEAATTESAASAVLPTETPTGLPEREIVFDRLSFRYPGSTRQVFEDLELTLPAGQCTAIVGLNGAGKTTLVKLLTRLYEPDGGAVRADGLDIAGLPVDQWRRQVGVIFQDFVRYELSAADNIALGAVDRARDPAVIRAVAARAGIAEYLDGLPAGFDTVLSRQYEGGVDLSGGQWQRVAIARALYALQAGAKVLVLDEPTAALDVRAEAEFFDRFVALTRGVTSLLISHRFSSVRRADRIVVLEHGRVVEQGTHESLLAAGGRYAELFTLQAERFTDEEEGSP